MSYLERVFLLTWTIIVALEHGLNFSVVLLSVMVMGNAGALFQLAFIRGLEDSYGIMILYM